MSYLQTSGTPAVYFAESDPQVSVSSTQTLVSRTITGAPAGTYLMFGSFRLQQATHGATRLYAKSGTSADVEVHGFGTHDYNQDKCLFGGYSHPGGDLAVKVQHDFESGTAIYGLSGDSRWGTKLYVIGPV